MKSSVLKTGFMISIVGLALSYQNCSKVGFKETPRVEKASTKVEVLNCSFNGQAVLSGESVMAYQNSTVDFGETCLSETRLCDDGALSGTYNYANCMVGAPASCLFNGETLESGRSVQAYQNSSVVYGESCQAEMRECQNGDLSGSFNFSMCEVGQPKSCLFNGQTIAHGQTAKAYRASSVAYGATCESEDRLCSNGALSGDFLYGSCSVGQPNACLFNGQTIAHGQKAKAYQTASVAYGSTCSAEDRLCSNGNLSGNFQYGSCTVGQPSACLFNGQTIAHGQKAKAYQTASVAYGNTCSAEDRLCSNGSLSGNFQFGSCTVGQPSACVFNGQQVAHGNSVVAYQDSTVPHGSSCVSQNRVCTNGSLSGAFSKPSCTVSPPACTPGNLTIKMVQKTETVYCPYQSSPGVYVVNIATNNSHHIYSDKTLTATVTVPSDKYQVYLAGYDRHCWETNAQSSHNPNGTCNFHNEANETYKIKIGNWTSGSSTDIAAGQTLTSTAAGTTNLGGQLQITAFASDPASNSSVMPSCVAFVKTCP